MVVTAESSSFGDEEAAANGKCRAPGRGGGATAIVARKKCDIFLGVRWGGDEVVQTAGTALRKNDRLCSETAKPAQKRQNTFTEADCRVFCSWECFIIKVLPRKVSQ